MMAVFGLVVCSVEGKQSPFVAGNSSRSLVQGEFE
jgi:hypothetical protein